MNTKVIKKVSKGLLDFVEIYLPVLTFSTMFIIFILGIIFRYLLNNPLAWAFELKRFLFIWTLLLAGCFTRREHQHVTFDLLYERVSPKTQAIFRIISNLTIAILFSVAWYPSFKYIDFLGYHVSTVLRIPYNYAFYPFLAFLILIIGHSVYDLYIDLRSLYEGDL